jgi:hypothetical protein
MLALFAALALLALPGTAFAQNAGDDQYSDPLAGQGGGSSGSVSDGGGSSGSSGSSGGGGGSSVTPTTPTSAAAGGTNGVSTGTAGTPQATAAGGSQGELPRTGFDVIVTIELGLAMLLGGLVSQRLLVLRDRRDS